MHRCAENSWCVRLGHCGALIVLVSPRGLALAITDTKARIPPYGDAFPGWPSPIMAAGGNTDVASFALRRADRTRVRDRFLRPIHAAEAGRARHHVRAVHRHCRRAGRRTEPADRSDPDDDGADHRQPGPAHPAATPATPTAPAASATTAAAASPADNQARCRTGCGAQRVPGVHHRLDRQEAADLRLQPL